MTTYRGPNAFRNGILKPAKQPLLMPRPVGTSAVIRQTDGPAFDNKFPKSRYPRGGGQSGLRPVLEVAEGGGSYIAKAVHLDGSTYLSIASLLATDNEFFSFTGWFKTASVSYQVIGVVDQENNYATTISTKDTSRITSFTCYPASGSDGVDCSAPPVTSNTWFSVIGTAKTNEGPDAKIMKLYIDDVDTGIIPSDTNPAFTMSPNGKSFFVFDDTQGGAFIGDAADLWIGPGVSLLTGNDISEATRRLFISADGKPVDPSGFPSGPMLFSGDADTFATNQGTGGVFTLTGTLTNASTSPSD